MEKPVFIENIKADNGLYRNLAGHAVRMDRTMRRFFRQPFVQSTLVKLLPSPPKQGVYKLTLLYSDSVISAEFSPFEKPVIKTLAMVDAGPFDYIFKSWNRDQLKAIRDFSGADEALIVRNGFVTNTTEANIVFRDPAGALFTPLHYIHSGTKREYYIRNKTVTAYPIKQTQMDCYETVILVNSMLDIEDDVSVPCSEIRPPVSMAPPLNHDLFHQGHPANLCLIRLLSCCLAHPSLVPYHDPSYQNETKAQII
jgi:4-amino-4-deoxychorismate lyase